MSDCAICSTDTEDEDDLFIEGFIGIIPFSLCMICGGGLQDMYEQLSEE